MRHKRPTSNSILSLGSWLLLTLGLGPTARADYQSTVLSQAPAGYYKLNETVKPQFTSITNSGSLESAADGSYSNLPSLNLPGPFAGSSSVGFDGVSQYAYTPWTAGLNTSSFSFEIWADPALYPNFAYLASSADLNSPRSGWYLAQDNGSTFGYGPAWVVRFFNQNAANPSVTLHATNSSAGVWTQIVITYDGTNTAKLYTNGVVADTEFTTTNSAGQGIVPNDNGPFTVGIRSSLNFEWAGQAAEPAIYPANLSAARVAAHYTAATTAPATYVSTVLADSPLLFDQYKAPVQPTAANLGTLGTAYNGLYLADAAPGAPGPVPPMFPGFPSTNKATAFDAGGGAVSLPPFNFNTNTITISCWVNATNTQLPGAGIVVCDSGTTGAGLICDSTGYGAGLGIGYYWNNDPTTYNYSPSEDSGLEELPNSQWAFVALVIQPTEADFYIALTNDPTTFMSVTNYYSLVPEPFDGATLIGTDAGNPTFSFNGAVDQVGIWNRSLSSGELYSQYATAVGGLAPIMFTTLPSPSQPIVAGNTLTLQANVGGTAPLSYQWFSNSVAISWGTNAVFTQTNFNIAADSGNYFVIVTNVYGSATSSVATVTGQNATAPVIVSQPVSATIYPGGVLNLTVVATGGGLVFNWQLNGTNIPGATGPTYLVNSVSNINAGTYTLGVTNALGGTSVGPIVITVPTLVPGSYAAVVDGDAPVSWWRLNDPSAATGDVMADAMGRNSGVYTNNGGLTVGNPSALNGQAGAASATFNGDGSYGYVPFFTDLASSKLTLEIWAKQATVANGVTAVSSLDSSGDGYGIVAESYWQGLDSGGTFGSAPGSQAAGNPKWDPTIYPGVWTHLVITYNPGSDASYPYEIFINGYSDGYIWSDGSKPLNTTSPFIVGGSGTGLATILNSYFIGSIEEVAFYNKVLSSSQIQNHYSAAFYGLPPKITAQPQSQNAFAGQSVTFSTEVGGYQPIGLQWLKNNVALPGQTNLTLTVSNVAYTAIDDVYSVLATNEFGSVPSSNALITVYPPPTWVNLTNGLVLHLAFDGDYSDSSGQGNNGTAVGSPTFVPGKIGTEALSVLTDTTNSVYNYVTLGDPADFQFGANGDFSVNYWVKFPTNAIPGDLPFLCSATNSTGGWGLSIVPAYQTGGWAWSIDNSNGTGAGVQGPAGSINDGNWHNVVETFTRTSNCSTYLDGSLVNTTPIAGVGDIDSGAVFNIGQDPTGAYQQSGTFALDDMGVWTRALTDIEARSIYIVGQNYGKSFNSTGPVNVSLYSLKGGKYGISWQAGTLTEATKITGPWTAVAGAAPPTYQFTPTSTNTFFKVGQ